MGAGVGAGVVAGVRCGSRSRHWVGSRSRHQVRSRSRLAAVTIYGSPTYVRIQAICAQRQVTAPQYTHLALPSRCCSQLAVAMADKSDEDMMPRPHTPNEAAGKCFSESFLTKISSDVIILKNDSSMTWQVYLVTCEMKKIL